MSTRTLWSLLIALVLLIPPALAAGQDAKATARGPWEISLFAGGFDDEPEFDPDGRVWYLHPNQKILFGGFLGYHLPMGFFAGAEGRYYPMQIRPITGPYRTVDMTFANALVGYTLPLHERFEVYGVAGGGVAYFSPRNFDAEMDVGLTYGGGARLFITQKLALTGEARIHQVPKALQKTARQITNLRADETLWGRAFTGGISYYFGKKVKDSDGDGVPDDVDRCPDTPAGVQVDAHGCPLDSDGDGVPDYLDRCPNTPRGTRVDEHGCPIQEAPPPPPPAPAPPPPPPPAPEPVRTYTFEDVNFAFDSAVLTNDGQARLRQIGQTLVTIPDAKIEVHGHTDSVGTAEYNMLLSRRRAEAVKNFLLANFSQLNAAQFTVRDFGLTQPIASNDTPEGRSKNRRVEIKVVQ